VAGKTTEAFNSPAALRRQAGGRRFHRFQKLSGEVVEVAKDLRVAPGRETVTPEKTAAAIYAEVAPVTTLLGRVFAERKDR
jgi:hypothetical protein